MTSVARKWVERGQASLHARQIEGWRQDVFCQFDRLIKASPGSDTASPVAGARRAGECNRKSKKITGLRRRLYPRPSGSSRNGLAHDLLLCSAERLLPQIRAFGQTCCGQSIACQEGIVDRASCPTNEHLHARHGKTGVRADLSAIHPSGSVGHEWDYWDGYLLANGDRYDE